MKSILKIKMFENIKNKMNFIRDRLQILELEFHELTSIIV